MASTTGFGQHKKSTFNDIKQAHHLSTPDVDIDLGKPTSSKVNLLGVPDETSFNEQSEIHN